MALTAAAKPAKNGAVETEAPKRGRGRPPKPKGEKAAPKKKAAPKPKPAVEQEASETPAPKAASKTKGQNMQDTLLKLWASADVGELSKLPDDLQQAVLTFHKYT